VPGKARIEQASGCESEQVRGVASHFLTFSLCHLLWIGTTLHAADSALPKFLGSQSCASSMCHGGADEKHNQFEIWSKKDFHTRAPATLSMARSARIAETLKIKDATSDARCTVCHNPFQTVPAERKDPRIGKLEGVSCESCHNAAENWLLTHTRSDLTHEQKVAAGMRDLKNLYVRANTCVACHQNLEPELRAAGHPELIFELDGQCVSMPRHWSETNRLRGAQAWLVGQGVAAREALVQSSSKADMPAELYERASAIQLVAGVAIDADADKFAREKAASEWSSSNVWERLRHIAASAESISLGKAPKGEIIHRAERMTLALERLLVALDLHKSPTLSERLDALFKDIQSRPEFEPKKFAEHLREFEKALPQ
jgi:hypothetical protein